MFNSVVFICLQLNNFISLRCVSQAGITLYFNCQSETAKYPVGMAQGAKPVKLTELVCVVESHDKYTSSMSDFQVGTYLQIKIRICTLVVKVFYTR